ncbi:polysaccharide deacetylase family protein [Sedimenticola thiotaurini]|uniref:NodB homology domain-containing protein n=1 Tax=Sedimenticola thiotaurini TaxID=1543721 RepID=A0A0F7JYI9_9GAMM|nr:polysaccharide deacetylase family protein [Sedimenticola thiotaurini]AKH19708.1 hypothetical protein AAY24_04310 [Sedimenticola thiotaurini]
MIFSTTRRWPFLQLVTAAGPKAKLSILNYHRVHPVIDPINPGEIDAERFTWQMELVANNFNVLTVGEAADLLAEGKLPDRSLCITFDDGYADNVEVALPILKQFSLRATFFIATGFLDGGRMWNDTVIESVRNFPAGYLDLSDQQLGQYQLDSWQDRHNAYSAIIREIKHLPQEKRQSLVDWVASRVPDGIDSGDLMMRSDQVRELHQSGMEIGGHTVTHPILSTIPDEQANHEIAEGKKQLEAITGGPVTVFAYPNGKPVQDYLPKHTDMVRKQGFKAAVSTEWGVSTTATDPYQLHRFTPWDNTPAKFMLRLIKNYV